MTNTHTGPSPREFEMDLAEKFLELHNSAAAEYKSAFARVGANMWRDDEAHKNPAESLDFIAQTMARLSDISAIYTITRPLTRLDPYPRVTEEQRAQLEVWVDEIHAKYSAQWAAILESE